MKQLILIGNFKMNFNRAQLNDYFARLLPQIKNTPHIVGVCAPFVYLPLCQQNLKNSNLLYGVQNMSDQISGAFTGEISPAMITDFGGRLVILGHSERRGLFGETSDFVARKLKLALQQGLTPIVCVGETFLERQNGNIHAVLTRQLQESLAGLTSDECNRLWLAYEPIWAIGTGVSATAQDAQESIAFIKQECERLLGGIPKVLYGGSLNLSNAKTLLSLPEIDGGLIGGASLNADTFAALISTNC